MTSSPLRIIQPDLDVMGSSVVTLRDLSVWFGDTHVLHDINLSFRQQCINCIIGPSGGGKSTLIRSINRMNDEVAGFSAVGRIEFEGMSVLDRKIAVAQLRTRIGIVFQKPCVFPKSIAENVLFGIQHLRRLSRRERHQIIEENLKAASLWKEVRHRLDHPAVSLSLGQQQRLCIARTLAVKPSVLLLDEPTSSLDPVSTRAIEELMLTLKTKYTIIFVTHNIQQAQRVADHLIFLCNGQVIEQGPKARLFANPAREETRKYLAEEFCDC